LAAAIVVGMDGTGPLDRSLSRWWRWRDDDAAEAAWFAADVGQDGRVPAPLGEIVRQLVKRDELEPFLDIFNHRTRPSEVLTPARLLGTTSRLLRRGDRDRREVVRETWRILGNDLRRRRLNRRPVYGV
jgi:hypothetical protein